MHLSMIRDPDSCMYDANIYVPRSLTLMHVCMMHISMILVPDPECMMHVLNNASFSRICVYMMLPDACMYDVYIYCS